MINEELIKEVLKKAEEARSFIMWLEINYPEIVDEWRAQNEKK